MIHEVKNNIYKCTKRQGRKYEENNIKQSIPALYHTIFLPTFLSAWTRIKGVKHLACCCTRRDRYS